MRNISPEQLVKELDCFLHKNDYTGAKQYLLSYTEAPDTPKNLLLTVRNELMGLCRKTGQKDEALYNAAEALSIVSEMGAENSVVAATTYINAATVKKAFGMSSEAIPLFEKAKAIYESSLPKNDKRLGGLYNNMGLAMVDEGRFGEAKRLYALAIEVMDSVPDGAIDSAVSYLNMASAAEAELGLLDAEDQIESCLRMAKIIIDDFSKKDGYYAFVCEKCASVFEYYGHFSYAAELKERLKNIYEGT